MHRQIQIVIYTENTPTKPKLIQRLAKELYNDQLTYKSIQYATKQKGNIFTTLLPPDYYLEGDLTTYIYIFPTIVNRAVHKLYYNNLVWLLRRY